MRTLAIGDVHGCFHAVETLVGIVDLDSSDCVVWLGDYVDRGPDSARVIEFLIDHRASGDVVCLRGNHEIMMERARVELHARRSWATCGGDATWDSYCERFDGDGLDAVPQSHWDFIAGLARYHETEDHIFVHASLDSEFQLTDQVDFDLFWGAFSSIRPHKSGKTVVCGHTSQKDGIPKSRGHAICIDTWACGDGWLTCLDVGSGQYWQASQCGETRTDWLESP